MEYAFFGDAPTPALGRFAELLGAELERAGFAHADGDARDANLVLSLVDPDDAKPFRRGARGTYVLAVFERGEHPEPIEESLRADYPMLAARAREPRPRLRARRGRVVHDHGARPLRRPRQSRRKSSHSMVIERLVPLASSRLVIDNEFRPDLEPELWDGDEITESIREAGVRLGALDLLPNPFPIEDLLDRARASPRQAPVRDRRAVVRQPLRAPGRRPLLDERERRRQDEARRSPAATSCSSRTTTPENGAHGAERAARTSSRGACRWTRSSTG